MTKLVAILNVTPDSFYDGGRHHTNRAAIEMAQKIAVQGADLIEVGGESSRPGATPVSLAEELERVIPVIEAIRKTVPTRIAVDTMKPEVAAAAVAAGAALINDIAGFQNPQMVEVAATTGVDICLMHMQGIPQTMQSNPHYPNGVINEIMCWFEERTSELLNAGINKDRIIIDPGVGFGKTVADNIKIIHNLPRFKSLGFPILLGISRKSFMQKILQRNAQELLAATIAVNALIVNEGVDYIRVHDVSEHRDLLDLFAYWRKVTSG